MEGILYWVLSEAFVYKREVTIIVGDKTEKYNYQNIDGHVIIDADILVEDFGFDRKDIEHQVGDVFVTMDDAALAWSLGYYELSNNEDNKGNPNKYNPREYASVIYENNLGYSFDEPNSGTYNHVEPPSAPSGSIMVAAIHSHPDLGPSTYSFPKRFKIDYGDLIGEIMNG
jgi:hypothetical protein